MLGGSFAAPEWLVAGRLLRFPGRTVDLPTPGDATGVRN